MEYITDMSQPLKSISEEGIVYYDIVKDYPELVYGIPLFSILKSFRRYGSETMKEIDSGTFSKYGNEQYRKSMGNGFRNQIMSSTGCCLRFKTNSKKIIMKASLKRKWDYTRMNLWCSSGFDVYMRDCQSEKWEHHTVFGPFEGKNMFAEVCNIRPNTEIMIFFPCYNEILELLVGSTAELFPIRCYKNKAPIVFYGNSVTQGASASRSGNAFCNIVSRQLDSAIVNYSASSGAHGQLSVAKIIGEINVSAIVIDYSRNAFSDIALAETHEKFYLELRKYHPYVPIIFLLTTCTNTHFAYEKYDDVITRTYNSALKRGENVFIIETNELLKKIGLDLVSIDGCHLNDGGMFLIADEISDILSKELSLDKTS